MQSSSVNERSGPAVEDRRARVLIENLQPTVDAGRYPAKRVLGDDVVVEVDLIADGHDVLAGVLLYRHEQESTWTESALTTLVNDRWTGRFKVSQIGRWLFTVEAWVDAFATWRRGLSRKVEANQDVEVDLLVGAELVSRAAARAQTADAAALASIARTLGTKKTKMDARVEAALGEALGLLVARYPDRSLSTREHKGYALVVDPPRARFSTWYELFPRSAGAPGKHGTFRDAESLLPYVASMGFDVLYLPPIHPIGRAFRKGRNNSLTVRAGEPGSPWAIGAEEGGHKSVHPELGTLDDFVRFRKKAEELGLAIALDIAFQASPDHPYVREHPEWFLKRPDGTIQYAENPPKKYQDIYPFDFTSEAWRSLWDELLSVFLFWAEHGVRIFRVDNPHTKALAFWEWCIAEVKAKFPDAIFLAEAFTRPKLMYALAKLGFTQSYTYFTWRNGKAEFTEYLTELTQPPVVEFFRPNFWPNTPDILPEHLQHGGRAAFALRLLLAGTMSSNYGIYGPAFELMEHVARPGSEEYLDNEKYELKQWNRSSDDSLRHLIGRLNRIRKESPALQQMRNFKFHGVNNDQLLCFSKRTDAKDDVVLVVVNLDYHNTQSGWVHLALDELGVSDHETFQVHDLVTDDRYLWHGPFNYVSLNPHVVPAHVFRVRHRVRTENDFDYYV